MASLSDKEIENLVHGTGGYEFVQTRSFPHFLVRHYLKKFKVPVLRHNFGKVAHEIDGKLFVRNEKNDGPFTCRACGR